MCCAVSINFINIDTHRISHLSSNPTASYFLKASMIFIVSMSLLLLIYVPKAHYHRMKKKQLQRGSTWSNNEFSATSDTTQGRGIGLRIVSMAPQAVDEEDSPATRALEDCENLREELLACKEKIRQLEQEKTVSISSDKKIERTQTSNDVEIPVPIQDEIE